MIGAVIRIIKEEKNIKKDILPKSGAGAQGTDTLTNTYKKYTPGQNITRFKDYKTTK